MINDNKNETKNEKWITWIKIDLGVDMDINILSIKQTCLSILMDKCIKQARPKQQLMLSL